MRIWVLFAAALALPLAAPLGLSETPQNGPPTDAYLVHSADPDLGPLQGYFFADAKLGYGELWLVGEFGEYHSAFTIGGSTIPLATPGGTLYVDRFVRGGGVFFTGVHIEDASGNETGVGVGSGRVEGFALVAAGHN